MLPGVTDTLARLGVGKRERILVALSGGADSTALLLALKELGYPACALHVNHGIRGAEADRDEEFCRQLCIQQQIPFHSRFVDIPALSKASHRGIEETARAERYRLLAEEKTLFSCHFIATAHNAEDNAETVLLHLVRGTGLSGLCGIPPLREDIIRPLLYTSRSEILAYLEEMNQDFVTDSTNRDTEYARNRIRSCVLPELCKINPECVRAIGRMTELLSEDERVLTDMAGSGELSCKTLLSLPEPVALRAIRRAYNNFCGEILSMEASRRCLALCKNLRPSARTDLPSARLRRDYDALVFEKKEPLACLKTVDLPENGTVDIPEAGISLHVSKQIAPENIHNSLNSFYLSCDKIGTSPVIRQRQVGDSFRKNSRDARKTLKKRFIDDKITVCDRDRIPVLASDNGVLAVVGYGADWDHVAVAGEMSLKIDLFPLNKNAPV